MMVTRPAGGTDWLQWDLDGESVQILDAVLDTRLHRFRHPWSLKGRDVCSMLTDSQFRGLREADADAVLFEVRQPFEVGPTVLKSGPPPNTAPARPPDVWKAPKAAKGVFAAVEARWRDQLAAAAVNTGSPLVPSGLNNQILCEGLREFVAAGKRDTPVSARVVYRDGSEEHGWAYGYESEEDADEEALSTCDAEDAEIVQRSMDAWCALAVGDNGGYGSARGWTQDEAETKAISRCSKRDTGARIVASISAFFNVFAAIAYSKSTGGYGWCHGADSCEKAEKGALSACDAEDAEIVQWSVNAWCALAVGDGGVYGVASGSTQEDAERIALLKCLACDAGPHHIVVSIFAAGQTPQNPREDAHVD